MSKSIPNDKNRLSIVRPDLIKYFENPEDADKVAVSAKIKKSIVCPHCGNKKELFMYVLSKNGFGCNVCGDGVSRPEKMTMLILSQINVDFIPQKIFKWSQRRRYDVYIPSQNNTNDTKFICEIHGCQHYKETNRGKSLTQEQENDRLKKQLSKNNGFDNYIVIDCRLSSFDWLKENIYNSLSPFFNLDSVNWELAYEQSSKSFVVQSWELFNSGINIQEISTQLKLHPSTVRRYLYQGNSIGKTNYIPDTCEKPVYQHTKDGVFIAEYKSQAEAKKMTGVAGAHIAQSCKGTRKTAGGFIWRYTNDENILPLTLPKHGLSRVVYQYDKNFNFIQRYETIKEVNSIFGGCDSSVRQACYSKGLKLFKGFIWMYESPSDVSQ